MKTLPDMEELGVCLPNVELGRTSLVVKAGANEEDIARLEAWLEAVGGSGLWWWGDYINHLVDTRGPEYARAKAASGYSPESLRQASWVSRHVDASRRLDTLSWSHHLEVASLTPTDQELLLCLAEEKGWSHKRLRAEIRASKAQVKNGPDQAPGDQRAARASADFESFAMWYQTQAPEFSDEQRDEWNQALRPLVADYLATCTETDLQALLEARAAS